MAKNISKCARWAIHGAVLTVVLVGFSYGASTPLQLIAEEAVYAAQRDYVRKDYSAALRSYQKAASLGSPDAAFQLGAMHERGEGVQVSLAEAAKWYQKAADAGLTAAMKNLGNMYASGEGVAKDPIRAEALYARAAELGDAGALFYLGQSYWMGRERDPQKALDYFHRAAVLGNPYAMNGIGIAYELGDGVARSDAHAYAYFKIAAEMGDATARAKLDKLIRVIGASDKSAGEVLYLEVKRTVRAESKFRGKQQSNTLDSQ